MKRILCILVICSLLLSAIASASAMDILNTYAENDVMQIDELGITLSSDAEDDTDTEQQTSPKLWCYVLDTFCYLVVENDEHMYFYDHIYNGIGLSSRNGVYDKVLAISEDVYNMSDEEAYFKMQEFIFLIEHLEIHPYYFNSLYEVCREETNDNGYYSKEDWDEFIGALKDAKKIYDEETDTKYSEEDLKKQIENDYINNAYFRLKNAFKSLCLTNTNYLDLDRDGDISLKDVVKLQRYIANLESLNISEKMVVSKSYYEDINMAVVTDMQKYIAQLIKLPSETPISNVQKDAIETALLIKDRYKSDPIYAGNYFEDILKRVFMEVGNLDLPSYD